MSLNLTMMPVSQKSRTKLLTQVQIQMKGFDNHVTGAVKGNLWSKTSSDCILRSKNKKFPCHRIILSMASPFLEKLLNLSPPGQMPEIILPDASAIVLQMIINMMYTGETCVLYQHRNEFVEICALLQLKGYEDFYEDTASGGGAAESFVSTVDYYQEEADETYETTQQTAEDQEEMDQDPEQEEGYEHDYDHYEEVTADDFAGTPETNHSAVRSFSSSYYQTPKREKGDADKYYFCEQSIIHTTKTKHGILPRIKLQANDIPEAYDRLQRLAKKMYDRFVAQPKDYDESDFSVHLIMNGNMLIHGQVTCIICHKHIPIAYTQNPKGILRQWVMKLFIKHLQGSHKRLCITGDGAPIYEDQ